MEREYRTREEVRGKEWKKIILRVLNTQFNPHTYKHKEKTNGQKIIKLRGACACKHAHTHTQT